MTRSAVRVLYRQRITDEATCYKVFRTEPLQRLDLRCERFEFCPKVAAKVCRAGVPFHEVPIRFHPRFAADGNKIRWHDGVEAIWTLLRWRFKRWIVWTSGKQEPAVGAGRRATADAQ